MPNKESPHKATPNSFEDKVLVVTSNVAMSRLSRLITSSSKYQSPYSQRALKPIVITEAMLSNRKNKKKVRQKPMKPSVDELMRLLQRSSQSASDTLSVGEGRLKMVRGGRSLPKLSDCNSNSNTFISAALEDPRDDMSEGSFASLPSQSSSHASLGSYNTLGTMGSFGSLGTKFSKTSAGTRGDVSLREMVSDIERRVKNRMNPPEYVPRLCDLPLSALSWSAHRAARAVRKQAAHLLSASPKIDIIGMHQSPTLILAKAYERTSKQHNAVLLKQEHVDEQRSNLIASIHNKMTRAERFAEALKVRQVQAAWLKALVLVRFNCTIYSHFTKNNAEYIAKTRERKAAFTLMRCLSSLVVRKFKARFKNEFMKKAKNSIWIMMMGIKVWRKKMAVKRIADFLRSFKGNYRIKTVVHRFVSSAHLIQRIGRDFIYINRTRAQTMTKIWDNLELKYIIKKLEERKKLETNAISNSKNNLAHVQIGAKMRIEMDKQAEKWKAIDAKMEQDLQRHRLSGILPNADSMRDRALALVLSNEVKRKAIEKYVYLRRKAFVLLRDEIRILRRKQAENFSKQDAHDLLKGNMSKIDDTIKYKYKVSFSVVHDNNPFLMFKGIDRGMLTSIIEMVHDSVGTFAIKVRGAKKQSMFAAGSFRKSSTGPGPGPGPGPGSSIPTMSMTQIHPSILAARKLKEEQEKKKEQQRIENAIDNAVRVCMGAQLEHRKLVLREDQKKRRGGVQLDSVV